MTRVQRIANLESRNKKPRKHPVSPERALIHPQCPGAENASGFAHYAFSGKAECGYDPLKLPVMDQVKGQAGKSTRGRRKRRVSPSVVEIMAAWRKDEKIPIYLTTSRMRNNVHRLPIGCNTGFLKYSGFALGLNGLLKGRIVPGKNRFAGVSRSAQTRSKSTTACGILVAVPAPAGEKRGGDSTKWTAWLSGRPNIPLCASSGWLTAFRKKFPAWRRVALLRPKGGSIAARQDPGCGWPWPCRDAGPPAQPCPA